MPPSEMLVEPVQTSIGLPFFREHDELIVLLGAARLAGPANRGQADMVDHLPVFGAVGGVVVEDLHVDFAVQRGLERGPDRVVVEFVQRGAQAERAVLGSCDEFDEGLAQAARQPHVLRQGRILRIRGRIRELPAVRLRAGSAAVEEDRMNVAVQRFGLDVDQDGQVVAQGQRFGRPRGRNEPIGVRRRRLRGVVTPLEGLDRMLRGGHRRAGWQPLVLVFEALDAPQEVALDDGLPGRALELGPLDREAEQVARVELVLLQVPGQRDDVIARDRSDGESAGGALVPHRRSSVPWGRSPRSSRRDTIGDARGGQASLA
jgi:hypothetical protein